MHMIALDVPNIYVSTCSTLRLFTYAILLESSCVFINAANFVNVDLNNRARKAFYVQYKS